MNETAQDLGQLNSGDSYQKELSRIENFDDLVKKVKENSEKSVKKFKTKEFIGQIYSSKLYTIEEIATLTGDAYDSILSELGEDTSYRGYIVYIPVKNAIYPNCSDRQVREYNKVMQGNLQDPKTKKNISMQEYLDSQTEEFRLQFKAIHTRIGRFPTFFQRGSDSEASYPHFCKVEEFDAGTSLEFGIFRETINKEL